MNDKRNLLLYFVIGAISIMLITVVGLKAFYFSEPVVVESFEKMTVTGAEAWAKEHDIKLEFDYSYDETIEKNMIVSQSEPQGSEISKGATIKLVISRGPDPNLEISLPNFEGYTLQQMQEFVQINKLSDVTYEYIESDKIDTDIFVSHNIETPTMRRSDMLIFTLSLGKENVEVEGIIVPDFSSYSKSQINNWGASNNVIIKYALANSKTIEKGEYIKQVPTANSITYARRTVTITYSSGKPVEAIDLSGKTKLQVIEWLGQYDNRINANFVEKYSNDVNKNVVISNSPKVGYIADGSTILVNLSLGRPMITNYSGQSYSLLESEVNALNKKGASITLKETADYSDTIKKGLIVSQDKSGEVEVGSMINIVRSLGRKIVIESQIDKSEQVFLDYFAGKLDIGTRTAVYSDKPANIIITHSPLSGIVEEGTKVDYKVSLGKPEVKSYIGLDYSGLQNEINSLNAKDAKLVLKASENYSDTYSKGKVISQDVSGSINVGSTITVVYSKGLAVNVPSFAEKNKSELINFIAGTNGILRAGTCIEEFSTTIAMGNIIRHDYAGATAYEGSVINYVLSKGPSGFIRPYKDLYQGGLNPETVRTEIESELKGAGFTNVTIKIMENPNGATTGAVWYQSHQQQTSLSAPIEIYIED